MFLWNLKNFNDEKDRNSLSTLEDTFLLILNYYSVGLLTLKWNFKVIFVHTNFCLLKLRSLLSKRLVLFLLSALCLPFTSAFYFVSFRRPGQTHEILQRNILQHYWFMLCNEVKEGVLILKTCPQARPRLNPLHPNISIHNLHTVLYTFPKVLTRRICLTIKSFFSWWSFPLFSWS